MPPKKGRKRRPRDRRQGEAVEDRPVAEMAPAGDDEDVRAARSDLPRLRVRATGFVLGVITMFIGILNVAQAFSGGSVVILVTGMVLIAMAIVLGVLSLAPGWVRSLLTRE
jgi:hypothetical protein